MNIRWQRQQQGFLITLVLAFLAAMAVWQAAPSSAQQRRKASSETETAAQYADAADKLAEENKWPEAIDAYKLVIRQHPKYGPAYKGLGDAYFNTGKWEDALATYKDAVRVAPRDAEAWYDLGYCYNAMGRHGEAFDPLKRAIGLDPRFAEAYYGIGYAYLRGTEFEKSLTWFKDAIRLDPNYEDAYYGLALVYTRLGKASQAEEARKKLFALDPKLVQKLDREIQTPQSALAGPLPPITVIESPKTVIDSGSKGTAALQDRTSQTTPQTTTVEGRTQPAMADPRNPSAPSGEVSQNPTVPVAANDKAPTIEQSTAPANLPARPDLDTTSRQLPPVEPESSKQGTVSPAPAQQLARVDGPTQPVPNESASQPSAPWPVTAWPAKAKRWALVIGVDNYSGEPNSASHGSANDAQTLRDALIDYAGFPTDQVILLSSDQPLQQQPSRSTIVQSLSTTLRGRVPKDGLLLVSFAGHGIERNGHSYLLPSDAPAIDDLSLLEYTTINVERLKELIRAIGVTQVLLVLDASKNDPTPGRGGSDNPMTSNFSRSFNFDLSRREVTSFATLYATAVGQRAYEYGVKKQGYFTWALVEGLRGEAANDKGEVTLGSLVKYVQETVPKYVHRDLGGEKQQVPFAVIQGYKEDELVIATVKPTTP